MTECAIKVYRAEGFSAFYRSYGTQLAMNVPFQCVHFIVYEAMQNATNPERTYNPMGHVISGGVSGALAAAFTTPLDVCKTLLNTQVSRCQLLRSPISDFISIWHLNFWILQEAEVLQRAQKTQISGFFNAAKMVYRLGGLGGFFQVKKRGTVITFFVFVVVEAEATSCTHSIRPAEKRWSRGRVLHCGGNCLQSGPAGYLWIKLLCLFGNRKCQFFVAMAMGLFASPFSFLPPTRQQGYMTWNCFIVVPPRNRVLELLCLVGRVATWQSSCLGGYCSTQHAR